MDPIQILRNRKLNDVCQVLEGEGNGGLVFNEYRTSIWDDDKVLEMDGGDGCTTM